MGLHYHANTGARYLPVWVVAAAFAIVVGITVWLGVSRAQLLARQQAVATEQAVLPTGRTIVIQPPPIAPAATPPASPADGGASAGQ